jgi:histidinol-phosphate phosphatase family protein
MSTSLKPAVFLDRDGTILTERGYLADPKKMKIYPFAFPALKRLSKAGYKLVVITNQSGVARGYLTLARLAEIHRQFRARFKSKGISIAGIYFCPHAPNAGCRCRKPSPYLVKKAARELKIDLKRSFVVGDQDRDILLARKSGAQGVLVLTGAGKSQTKGTRKQAAHVTRTLLTAADWIVGKK